MKKQKEIIRKNGKVNNLLGMYFGHLKVISKTTMRKNNHVIWECKCDCGEITYKRSCELNPNNPNLCCGCIFDQKKTINNVSINQVFGRLKIIEILDNNQVKCKCECNKICIKDVNMLVSGGVKSCGCLASEHWLEITKKATAQNIILNTNIGRIQSKNISRNSTTGVTGVYFNKKTNSYLAKITFQKKIYYLGTFYKKQDAINSRKTAEKELFGDFIKWYKKNYKNKMKEVI